MSNINFRKSSSFMATLFKAELAASGFEPRKRIKNIAWPSECLAQLGQIPVGECKRALFYKILGAKPTEPMSVRGQGICDAGLMYEDYYIDKYRQLKMLYDEQVPIEFTMPNTNHKVMCTGRIDAIIKYENTRKAIEMKSISAYKAPTIMGNSKTVGLPAVKNLMQAMLYKYYLSETEEGKKIGVDEVYLKYINRSDNSICYYRVNLDKEGYAIITAFDQAGRERETISLQNVTSFDELIYRNGNSSSQDSRLAELRVSVYDIFSKFDLVYDYAKSKMLPGRDYTHVYDPNRVDLEYRIGRISKQKYNKALKGEPLGDDQCKYCDFSTKCLNDSGIKTT